MKIKTQSLVSQGDHCNRRERAYQTDWIIQMFNGKGQLFVPHWITVTIDHTRLQFLKKRPNKRVSKEMKNKSTNRKSQSNDDASQGTQTHGYNQLGQVSDSIMSHFP